MKYSCRNAMLIISNTFTLSNSQVFLHTFDEGMARKLAIRNLRKEIGSMDYIHQVENNKRVLLKEVLVREVRLVSHKALPQQWKVKFLFGVCA